MGGTRRWAAARERVGTPRARPRRADGVGEGAAPLAGAGTKVAAAARAGGILTARHHARRCTPDRAGRRAGRGGRRRHPGGAILGRSSGRPRAPPAGGRARHTPAHHPPSGPARFPPPTAGRTRHRRHCRRAAGGVAGAPRPARAAHGRRDAPRGGGAPTPPPLARRPATAWRCGAATQTGAAAVAAAACACTHPREGPPPPCGGGAFFFLGGVFCCRVWRDAPPRRAAARVRYDTASADDARGRGRAPARRRGGATRLFHDGKFRSGSGAGTDSTCKP